MCAGERAGGGMGGDDDDDEDTADDLLGIDVVLGNGDLDIDIDEVSTFADIEDRDIDDALGIAVLDIEDLGIDGGIDDIL